MGYDVNSGTRPYRQAFLPNLRSRHMPFLLAGVMAISSCSASRQNPNDAHPDPQRSVFGRVALSGLQIPPNTCRIVATLLVVDTASRDRQGPCADAPCFGLIRIDTVIGYGSAFPHPLSAGQIARTRFSAPLQPRDSRNQQLIPGSRFQADAETVSGPAGSAGDSSALMVQRYTLR